MEQGQPYGGANKRFAVKNKTPNPIQITAEQLLREAVERQAEEVRAPRQRVVDEAELEEYRIRKRKEYEDALRRQRHNLGIWIRYAEWEATQKDFRRARSVFERALGVEFHNTGLWFKYIDMEMRNKNVNSARNLYDRVTQLLPRVDTFWFRYIHMEEILGNYAGARAILERWMEWEPEDKAWMLYVNFEDRCGEIDRARNVFEKYLQCKPSQVSFLKFCKFEEKHRNIIRARAGFEKAVSLLLQQIEVLPESALDEHFFIKFAQFEERQKEFHRAKSIFEQSLERVPKGKAEELFRKFVAFQKQRGDRDELERTVINKRRIYYEEVSHDGLLQLVTDPHNYEVWFDLLRLEEVVGDIERIREVYERAVAQLPPILEKKFWKRYIYLWINYALFEEIQAKDIERCRGVYDQIIQIVPHKKFSFSKIWIYYAEFEIRQLQLDKSRKIFGRAIAECGKSKIFTAYSALELRLGNIDRCRKIRAKCIELTPTASTAWIAMIDLEMLGEEITRARALCEIAISCDLLDMPELIWKKYIDIESELGEMNRVRLLYERLIEKTKHFKVFKAYSSFEFEQTGSIERARDIINRGILHCKDFQLNEERKLLIDHLILLEKKNGNLEDIKKAQSMKPKSIKIRRSVIGPDGTSQGFEEITQYIFKEDGPQLSNLSILEKAKAWKKKQQEQQISMEAAT